MDKLLIRKDVFEDIIEKGYGKRDYSKLTKKVITDKNGHRRTVFVKNEMSPVKTQNKNLGTNSKDDEKDYYELIESLNSYDRTDPDELEKYKRENERLQKNYSKENVKGYFDYSKKQLSGSKEDIKNYLGRINVKNPSNVNYLIANRTFNKLINREYSNIFEKLQSDYSYGDITLDEMAEKIYENIHPNEKKSSSETKAVNTNDIDKFLFAQDKNNIRNSVKEYLQKNPEKKEEFMKYVSKKHDEAVSKKNDADVYLRYAENEEEEKKYKKEWDKWNELVSVYGAARYYN